MAAATTSFTYSYSGKHVLDEIFYAPQEDGQDVFSEYKVMGNVKSKKTLYIPGALSKIMQKYSSCGWNEKGQLVITDKQIDPEKLKVNTSQCQDEFDDTIFDEAKNRGVDIDDLQNTVMDDIVKTQIVKGLKEDIPRVAWFGDKTSSSEDYDMYNGWMDAMFASSGDITSLDMSSSATYEASADTLATDGALESLKYLYSKQDKALRKLVKSGQAKYYVTATVADNLMETYENTGTDSGLQLLKEGTRQLMFRGVKVVEVDGWDTHLADSDNPFKSRIGSNLIVLSAPMNLIIGTDVNDPFSQFKVWFEEKNEKVYYKYKWKMDVNILHDKLVAFAY